MKLYTFPGACSTAVHIALQWTGQPFDTQIVTHETLKSPDYLSVNPTGSVPALVDGDFVLTQNAAILGYVADRHPDARLLGDGSALQRAEAMRWLMLGVTDMHRQFGKFFSPASFLPDPAQHEPLQESARGQLRPLYERIDAQLDGRDWIVGFRSIADAYLYVMLRWAAMWRIDLGGLARLAAFQRRMEADHGVQVALKAEGLA